MDEGDRTRHWPAIERRTGRPAAHWLALLAEAPEARYPEQMALLQEHGLSRTHANALVQFARGSTTSRRFTTLDGYLSDADPVGAATLRTILEGLVARHPGSTIAFAWNQPFLVIDGQRRFSVAMTGSHLLAAPWSAEVLDAFRDRLRDEHGLVVNRKTFRLPFDWPVDTALLDALVAAELAR